MTIGIGLVDDHPAIADGLRRAIEAFDDLVVVGVAGSIDEGRRLLARDDVDVAVVDLRLPDGTGTALVQAATERGRPATLVLSTFDHPTYLGAAFRLGAAGFLLKTAPTGEIVAAIRTVAGGGLAYTADQMRTAAGAAVALSPRERAVVARVLAARSNDEIAADLGLATKTVEQHLVRLFARLGVSSRTELALRAEREGWLDQ